MKVPHVAAACLASTGLCAYLQQVVNFGSSNPTIIQLSVYVPDKVVANPAVVVGLHACQGAPQDLYVRDYKVVQAADRFGEFVLVLPGTQKLGHCWDVNNATGSLTHDGIGDAVGVVSAVKYALAKYNADPARVFAYGASTGMVSALAGAYPDVFAAAAVFAGVPFACQSGADDASLQAAGNQSCARGALAHTPDEWAAFVTNAYPNYNGTRPRMMVAHGRGDVVVDVANAYASLAQWSTVLGLTNTENVSEAVDWGPRWTRLVYDDGTKLVGYVGDDAGPDVASVASVMLKWFGLSS